jgi:hypothetical protein
VRSSGALFGGSGGGGWWRSKSGCVSKVDRVGSLHFHVTNEVHLVWKWCDQVESLIMGPRWEECMGFSF